MSLAILLLMLAQDVPLASIPVPDTELATQRGGFMLPNGIDVALTVQTQTSINGVIVLRSVFRADQGPATLTVFAPKQGETVASGGNPNGGSATNVPTVTYDSRSGLTVTPAQGGPSVVITTRNAADAVPTGLTQIANGTQATTDSGVVSQMIKGGLQSAELRAADLSITHLAGTVFGSAIINSGSDRAIDTTTTVGLDLRNAGATILASAALRVEDLAISAMQGRQ